MLACPGLATRYDASTMYPRTNDTLATRRYRGITAELFRSGDGKRSRHVLVCRESYLRFCSQKFCLTNFHESIHLCNHAIQCKYTNCGDRDPALPSDNMWDATTFKEFLKYDRSALPLRSSYPCRSVEPLCHARAFVFSKSSNLPGTREALN